MSNFVGFEDLYPRYAAPLATIVNPAGFSFDPATLDPDRFTRLVHEAAEVMWYFPEDDTLISVGHRLDLAVDCLTVAIYEPDLLSRAGLVGEACAHLNGLFLAAQILDVR